MKNSKELLEQRGVLDLELDGLAKQIDNKSITEDGEKRFDTLLAEIETLNTDIATAQKREAGIKAAEARKAPSILINPTKTDNEEQVKEQFQIRKLIYDIGTKGKPEGLEAEVSQQGLNEARDSELEVTGVAIPAFIIGNDKRAAVNTTSTSDTPKTGYYVATDTLVDRWIDVLRNNLTLVNAGAQFWDGMQGNVSIPKKTTAASVAWLSETAAITPNNSVNGAITMSPKRVGGAIPFTKTLLRQTSLNIEQFIRQDLAAGIAEALQVGALSGTGSSGQPTGISTALTTTGGSNLIAMGTNGLAPTWASLVEMVKQVAIVNGDVNKTGFMINAATMAKLSTVLKDAGSGLFLMPDNGMIYGRKTYVTNSVRSNLTKGSSSGVCSEAFYGNWNDLIIASWGGLDISVDPFSLNLSNQIQVVVNGYYDVAIQREGSFSTIKDYLTT